ncbi:MAG: hypothetical protein ACFFEF_15005 [Candidatus Thorarchaeota archaeon]
MIQVFSILTIGTFGEHFVSSQGYYHYTRINGIFLGKVAFWIPFMWLFAIQGLFLIGILLGFNGANSSILAGIMGAVIDLSLIEPYCSRKKSLWIWNPVRNGYFRFVPQRINRFTAPTGNYIVWTLFPILMGLLIIVPSVLFQIS